MFSIQLEINIPEEKSKLLATNKFEYSQTQEEEEFRREFGEIQTLNCVCYLSLAVLVVNHHLNH